MQSDFGAYKLLQRIDVDQVPFNLDGESKRSFVPAEKADSIVIGGQPGQEKRFGTLQIYWHADPDTPQAALGIMLETMFQIYPA